MSTAKKRVGVISLGGTIAMKATPGGLAPSLGADDLAAAVVPDCGAMAIDWFDFARVPSANIGFSDLVRLAAQVEHMQSEGYHGAVISQGTDTLEETALALELLVRAPIDIALTGAMRGSSAPGADGAANLLGALNFLQESAGQGEVVVAYGYPGGEIDLLRRGLVHGGDLSPAKARVLLTLLLMDGAGDCRARFVAAAATI